MPVPPFGSAAVPAASVPIRFPATRSRKPPVMKMPPYSFPEMTLPAPARRAADHVPACHRRRRRCTPRHINAVSVVDQRSGTVYVEANYVALNEILAGPSRSPRRLPVLPEIRLPAPAAVPPIVFSGESGEMVTPPVPFGTAPVPA